MQAYSLDLRERIVRCWQQGEPKGSIAQRFMVSLSSVKRYIKRFETYGHVYPTVQVRMQGKLTKRLRKRLVRQVEAHPDFTLTQHAELWQEVQHMRISQSTLSRALRRLGFTRKKKTIGAVERIEPQRKAFRTLIKKLNVEDVTVLDESGTHIGMIPLYARAWRGCRVYDRTIRNHGLNLTLLAALNINGIQAAMTVEGSVDKIVFEVFIRDVLLPTLRPGQIVIMDNLSSHKNARVETLLKEAGCQVLFLPAYSPDFSPIEEAFSKLKAFIRRCRCQTLPELLQVIEQGMTSLTSPDIRGWFGHAGFSVTP